MCDCGLAPWARAKELGPTPKLLVNFEAIVDFVCSFLTVFPHGKNRLDMLNETVCWLQYGFG
jgi:hypothetical protein